MDEIGMRIVIADRGFVWVGRVAMGDDFVVIREARNIRIWGTQRGLGQLALEGPTPSTRLDPTGTVTLPLRALIALLDTEDHLWKS